MPSDSLSNKYFSKKIEQFEASNHVFRDAQNAGFYTIYPRASGGLKRPLDQRPDGHLALRGVEVALRLHLLLQGFI